MTTFAEGWDEVFGDGKRKRRPKTETRPRKRLTKQIRVNGKRADAKLAREVRRGVRVIVGVPAATNQRLSNQRLASNEMLAVPPSQAAEVERACQAKGIDATYDRKTGIPSFRRYKDHDKVYVEQFKRSFDVPEGTKI